MSERDTIARNKYDLIHRALGTIDPELESGLMLMSEYQLRLLFALVRGDLNRSYNEGWVDARRYGDTK